MKLKSNCEICSKPLELVSEEPFLNGFYRVYKCGHAKFDTQAAKESLNGFNFSSITGDKLAFDFQKDGVEFMVNSLKQNGAVINGDPMGLGKTMQALLAAKKVGYSRILIVVKSATTYQWFHESKDWFSNELWSCFIIRGSKSMIPPGFSLYIISMDTLSRFLNAKNGGLKNLSSLGIDCVIVDECHSFKNPDSARSQALVAFLQDISQGEIERETKLYCISCKHEWNETAKIKINLVGNQSTIYHRHTSICPKCGARVGQTMDRLQIDDSERKRGLIMLSGTLIKNRSDEWFIPLNLCRPDVVTSLKNFRSRWMIKEDNQWTRIAPWRLEEFRKFTSQFFIRREKTKVLDLPPFRRTFQRVDIESPEFKKAYNAALDELQKKVDQLDREINWQDVQDNLMTLRRIIGQSKVDFAIEYTEEFLESVENEKLAIGIHHESVRDTLYFALQNKKIKCLKLSGEDSAENKDRILRKFNSDPDTRVIIINMLAGGVGLNIQAANNVLTLERQWNAADEEQFEGRFWRQGQTLPVLNEYMIAAGLPTEDFFSEMVERKRQICGETLDGWDFRQDKEAIRELVSKTLATRI